MIKKSYSLILSLAAVLTTATVVCAFTSGIEPPAKYINNLKTCTKSYAKISGAMVEDYTIKGLLPDGRCEVVSTRYVDFANNQVYQNFVSMTKGFSGMTGKDSNVKIPTQAYMIEKSKAEKTTKVCKFTKQQRLALYNAYLKHDNKNSCVKHSDGTQSCSYSSANKSSYDKLMDSYKNEACTSN